MTHLIPQSPISNNAQTDNHPTNNKNDESTNILTEKIGSISKTLDEPSENQSTTSQNKPITVVNSDSGSKSSRIKTWGQNFFSSLQGSVVNSSSWLYHKTTDSLTWGLFKTAEMVAFWRADLAKVRASNLADLEKLTGGEECGRFLAAISPTIAETIEKTIAPEEGRLHGLLLGEHQFLTDLIDAILPKIIVNIGHDFQKNSGNEEKVIVTAGDIGAYLASFAIEHMTKAEKQLDRLRAIDDPKTRRNGEHKILVSAAEELLFLGLPNGSADLPVNPLIRNYLWHCLQEYWLPDMLFALYHQFADFHSCDAVDQLNHTSGGDVLTVLCSSSAEKMIELGPGKLNEQKDMIATAMCHAMLPKENKDLEFHVSWLSEQIRSFNDSNNPHVLSVWQFLGESTKQLVARMLCHMVQGAEQNNVLFTAVNRLLSVVIDFEEKQGKILEERYLTLQQNGQDPVKDKDFLQLFQPLCDELLQLLGFDQQNQKLSLPPLLTKLMKMLIKDHGPKLVASYYRDFLLKQPAGVDYQQHLQEVLKLNTNSQDAEEVAAQVENLCGFFGEKISKSVQNLLHSKWSSELPALKLPHTNTIWTNYIQKGIETLLFKFLVNYIESTLNALSADKRGESPPSAMLLKDMIVRLIDVFDKRLPGHAEVAKAQAIADPYLRQEALRKAYAPLAEKLSDEILSEIPIAAPFQELFWNKIKGTFLPDLLVELCRDISLWPDESENYRNQMKIKTGTTYLPESCRVLAKWISDFLPAYLAAESDSLAELLYNTTENYLANTDSQKGKSVDEYLRKNALAIKEMLSKNILGFAKEDAESVIHVWPFTKEYLETSLLNFFNRLGDQISSIEIPGSQNYQKDFLVTTGSKLLRIVEQYFRRINEITQKESKSYAYQVEQEKMVTGFGELLHRGMSYDKDTIEELKRAKETILSEKKKIAKLRKPEQIEACREKIKAARKEIKDIKEKRNQWRIDNFFKPFTQVLMQFADLSSAECLPFPSPIREQLWELIKSQLLPNVLFKISELLLKPSSLNLMMTTALKDLTQVLDALPENNQEQQNDIQEDDAQRELNKVCGELVLQLANLIPKSVIKTIFKIDKVQVSTAEMIGRSVRRQLGKKWALLGMMDKAMSALPQSLHSGTWDGEPAHAVFKPYKIVIDANGKKKQEPVDLAFRFFEPEDELVQELYEEVAEKNIAKETKKMMVLATHKAFAITIKEFFLAPLRLFQNLWNQVVDKVFGKYSQDVRNFFEFIGCKTILKFIGTIFEVVSLPIRVIFWACMDFYIGWRANHVQKSMTIEMTENLMYHLLDELLRGTQPKNHASTGTI
jgi:hypothetical protein